MRKGSFTLSPVLTCLENPRFWIQNKRSILRVLPGLLLFATMLGCNRQDTEAISRIGRKVTAHARASAEELSPKLDLPWNSAKHEPTLQEKIQDRLRWENTLADVALEVHVKDKEVELKGIVKNALQRQRAVELAETVAGVDKVTNAIQIIDAVR